MKYPLVYSIDLFSILDVYMYVCIYMYITKNILNKIWRNELILSSLDLSTILNKRAKFFQKKKIFYSQHIDKM